MSLIDDFVRNAEAAGYRVHRGGAPEIEGAGVSQALYGLAELFEAIGSNLPSALAIVTGPSRSADIEQKLTVGVHGPGEVHVVLIP